MYIVHIYAASIVSLAQLPLQLLRKHKKREKEKKESCAFPSDIHTCPRFHMILARLVDDEFSLPGSSFPLSCGRFPCDSAKRKSAPRNVKRERKREREKKVAYEALETFKSPLNGDRTLLRLILSPRTFKTF